ncbi:hypothetical protein BKA61DRAFT_232653 [Leptodontidium sp. MPI-SDFR-AT-0119]|nr:hypothetical protein BKA61DRAFT_232653 [Leptodontidium sp. MPI-SDFR-AT-0119]
MRFDSCRPAGRVVWLYASLSCCCAPGEVSVMGWVMVCHAWGWVGEFGHAILDAWMLWRWDFSMAKVGLGCATES